MPATGDPALSSFSRRKSSKPVPVRFGELHRTFLEHLSAFESVETPGSELVDRIATNLESDRVHHCLPAGGRLDRRPCEWLTGNFRNLKLRCGISHGDFTPWNTLVSDRRLFVFDWESAESQLLTVGMPFISECKPRPS